VLEAKSRVGGCTVSLDTEEGVVAGGGGQWVDAKHTRVFTLIEELGLSTFDTYTAGRTIYQYKGRRKRSRARSRRSHRWRSSASPRRRSGSS
jgi:monoamine oxidase